MIIAVLVIFIVICVIVAMAGTNSSKSHIYYCPKCGNLQGYVGNSTSNRVCEKCHTILNEVPEKYVSNSTSTGFIAPNMKAEFERVYIKPLVDKYGKPETNKLYYCKQCGTIHRFTGYSTDKLQCSVCFLQLYELSDEYKEDIVWRSGLGSSELLSKSLKGTSDFSETLADNRDRIHDEQWKSFNEAMAHGKQILEEQSKKVTCKYCGSENVEKIGTLSRVASVELLGAASSKIGKQWHCKHCNSDF